MASSPPLRVAVVGAGAFGRNHLRVYRESVTAALGELRKAGIIAVDRKRIRVLNRIRLERASRE